MSVHATACVLSVGDELVLGQALDTNGRWISERLSQLGVRTLAHATLPDSIEAQSAAMLEMARRADLVVATGGLGPTMDDLTRRALADAMGDEIIEDEAALAFLEGLESERGRTLTPERRAQALRPSSGRCLPNEHGTAPGVAGRIERDGASADVFCLPGPPREMRPMFEAQVLPALRTDPAQRVGLRVLRTFGFPESDAGARLAPLMRRGSNPEVGTTASGGIVSVRLRATGADAPSLLDRAERDANEALGDAVFGTDNETLETLAVRLLRERSERVIVAESCTGGLLGAALTRVPGSSDVFDGGFLTYANEAKVAALGVDADLIARHGAVSAPVARAMAEGALRTDIGARSAHALAVSGVAGPGGGSAEKPVGTVFVARAERASTTEVRRFRIAGDRDDVRARSVTSALGMLSFRLRGVVWDGPLLWEVADA